MFKKKSTVFLLLICVAIVFSIVFFRFKKPNHEVPIVKVIQGSIVEQAEAVGYIKARRFATVKSQIDGMVEAIYHDEGDYVTKDTPLVKIKPAPTPETYAEAHQNLANANTEEREKGIIFDRQKKLLLNGIIAANNVDYTAARNAYIQAQNDTVLAQQKLALLEHGEIMVGGKQIANVVVSPIDGNILYRGIDIGDPVISISSAQSATALFTVANMQDLMFQGSVDERDAAKVKIGMVAEVKVGSLPNQTIVGKITKIALQSDKEKEKDISEQHQSSSDSIQGSPFNVGFKIEITDLHIPKGLVLRSGYSATASVAIKKVNNVLVLPLRVIQFKDNKPYVLLPTYSKEEEPRYQPIEMGISDNINVEIKNGLKLGDQVIDQPDKTVTAY